MPQLESALERLSRSHVRGLKKGVRMEQVAGYFRVSRARDDMKAPELYLEEIERYCRYKRVKLGKIFSDIDFSGRKGSKARPGLDALIGSRHRFSAVVVPKLSRFGRSMGHLMQLFDTFEDDGIALVFLDLGLDTSTSQGRLLRNVMAAFAEFEGDVRSDYSRAAHDHRARRGLPNGGWAPFGYRRHVDKYAAQPGEAEIVTEIFDLYQQDQSMFAIGRLLNERGTPSPKGRLWTKPTLRNMLQNPHYAALRRYGDALVEAAWKPLITRETWDAVQERLAAITNRGVARPPEGLYLLSGLIECGVCGTTLHHRTKQDRVPGQYVCRGDRGAGYCRGGGIAEHRAQSMVVAAYLQRYGSAWIHDAAVSDSPVPLGSFWQDASLVQRRRMLGSALERLVLLPRPEGNRRGTGLPRGRTLEISWAVREGLEPASVLLGERALEDIAGLARPACCLSREAASVVGPMRCRGQT